MSRFRFLVRWQRQWWCYLIEPTYFTDWLDSDSTYYFHSPSNQDSCFGGEWNLQMVRDEPTNNSTLTWLRNHRVILLDWIGRFYRGRRLKLPWWHSFEHNKCFWFIIICVYPAKSAGWTLNVESSKCRCSQSRGEKYRPRPDEIRAKFQCADESMLK